MQDIDRGLSPESAAINMFTEAAVLIRRARVEKDPANQQAILLRAELTIKEALRMTIPSIVRGEIEVGFLFKPSKGLREDERWKTV